MKKTKKTPLLVLIAALVALGVSGAYTFFFIAMKKKTELTTEINTEAKNLEVRQSKISFTLASLKERSEDIQKLDEYFIKKSEIVDFAKNLEALGQNSSTTLSIEALDPGFSADKAPILSFRIEARGTFVNAMRALELLENFPTKLEWTSVKIVRLEGEEQAPAVKIKKQGVVEPRVPLWKLSVAASALNFTQQ